MNSRKISTKHECEEFEENEYSLTREIYHGEELANPPLTPPFPPNLHDYQLTSKNISPTPPTTSRSFPPFSKNGKTEYCDWRDSEWGERVWGNLKWRIAKRAEKVEKIWRSFTPSSIFEYRFFPCAVWIWLSAPFFPYTWACNLIPLIQQTFFPIPSINSSVSGYELRLLFWKIAHTLPPFFKPTETL